MFLQYQKILAGKAQPRWKKNLAYVKEQARQHAQSCGLCAQKCGRKIIAPPALGIIRQNEHLTKPIEIHFRQKNIFEKLRGKELSTPAQAAAWINSLAKKGASTLVWSGEVAHSLPFMVETLSKIKKPLPLAIFSQPCYSEETASILNHLADIFIFKLHYFEDTCAQHFNSIQNFNESLIKSITAAEKEGDILLNVHIVPEHIECCAKTICDWASRGLKNYSAQFIPFNTPIASEKYPELNRKLSLAEFSDVLKYAERVGAKTV